MNLPEVGTPEKLVKRLIFGYALVLSTKSTNKIFDDKSHSNALPVGIV